ncbi:hypothetical protein [Legionella maioricensis]|uniref:Uncharacterized protein n=1 Tax=Legionella maioricensis TaxID=2896528 RepID=A0A9X2CZY4_9GAMM|nr:hypothetical protein [Legionella maioricensis]MCL9683774.1 hypothetical protein [Legionella maioricensis]MCL9686621.1 hypothetical protein [Legionella maioricensis]
MNTKNKPITPQKILSHFTVGMLTIGASLILGCLSLSGMYALSPFLPFALAAFGLSVAYEGEIYLQNIKGALEKLFKRNYLENYMAKEYLLENFPEDTHDPDCPQFFKDYKKQLKLLSAFGHKELNKESKNKKKQIEKKLRDMEKWFALQLFSAKNKTTGDESIYAQQLQFWLEQHGQQVWQERIKARRSKFNIAKGFSLLAGLFMGLGSTYLIVEAFSVIPFLAVIPFAFWPIMIVPMALIAGVAYGMLTFNTITDLINNNTVIKWYNRLRHDLSQGLTVRNVFMTTMAVLLVGLAIALTICTAGTWWTVATNARPLFEWMKRMPSFVMGVINPVITGLSAIFFNIQNTAESLDLIDEAIQGNENIFQRTYRAITESLAHLRATENWLQIVNPFRLILKLTITPLRILLFLGHLISIAVTSDRMPGVPQIVAVLTAMISEGFEDAPYFIGHAHPAHDSHPHDFRTLLKEHLDGDEGHTHDGDIPTWVLKTITLPLYALAALWDSGASTLNRSQGYKQKEESIQSPYTHQRRVLSLQEAWNKQRGIKEEEHVELPSKAKHPSKEWSVEHAVFLIEKYQTKHFENIQVDPELAEEKVRELDVLKNKIRTSTSSETLAETLVQARNQPVYNQHRWFAQAAKTSTQMFIEDLPERVNVMR